jgi:hypothetical protein
MGGEKAILLTTECAPPAFKGFGSYLSSYLSFHLGFDGV